MNILQHILRQANPAALAMLTQMAGGRPVAVASAQQRMQEPALRVDIVEMARDRQAAVDEGRAGSPAPSINSQRLRVDMVENMRCLVAKQKG